MSTTMPFCVERLGDERHVDDEGRAMQRLRRPEHGAAERMGDHDVVANFDGEHEDLLSRIGDELAEYAALRARMSGSRSGSS